MLLIFIFLGICTFGCCRIWPLPPQHRQTLPSFTLSLIVCFKGSGETNSICLKTFLARLCLLKLMVRFVTDSTLLGGQSLGLLLSWKYDRQPVATWEALFPLGTMVSGKGHSRYTPDVVWVPPLKGSVTPFQERDSCHSPLPWSLFKLLLRKRKKSLSVSSDTVFPVLLANSQGGSRHSSLVWIWA